MSIRTLIVLLLLALFGLMPEVCQAQALSSVPQKHDLQAQAHREKSDQLRRQGAAAEALREVQAAATLDERSSQYRRDLGVDNLKIGNCLYNLHQPEQAIAYYQKAITLAQQVKDRKGEEHGLNNLGWTYLHLGQFKNSVRVLQRALPPAKAVGDTTGQIQILINLGYATLGSKQFEAAMREFQQILPLCQKGWMNNDVGFAYEGLGRSANSLHHYPQALQYYQMAQAAYQKSEDNADQANIFLLSGAVQQYLHQYALALQSYQKASILYQKSNSSAGIAMATNDIATVYKVQQQFAKAIPYYQQALTLDAKIHDTVSEARTDLYLGYAYGSLKQYDLAIATYQQALRLAPEKYPAIRGNALLYQAACYTGSGDLLKAFDCCQQALPFFQQARDLNGQVLTLASLGIELQQMGRFEEAKTDFAQAIPVAQQMHNPKAEAKIWGLESEVYSSLGQYDQAVQCLKQQIQLFGQSNDMEAALPVILDVGNMLSYLGENAYALQLYQASLAASEKLADSPANRYMQSALLANIGNMLNALGQYQKAIQTSQQALSQFTITGNIQGQASSLQNLGNAYLDLKQDDTADDYYHQSLAKFRTINDTHGEAEVLANLGKVSDQRGDFAQAADDYLQALPLLQQMQARAEEAQVLGFLMRLSQEQHETTLAIFYGKQSVNVLQSIRRNIVSVGQQIQNDYIRANQLTYRQLADLLIQQGRLPEAEQVLNLLKNQEFFDFVRRDPSSAPTAGETSLTPLEASWRQRYQVIAEQITAIGTHKDDLIAKQQQAAKGQVTLTDAEKQKLGDDLHQADADLTVANKAFQDFLTQIAQEAQTAGKSIQDRVETVTEATAFQDTLRQLGTGTVAIYTIVEPDKVRLLVVTSQTQIAREYPIKDTDLRQKVEDFRKALQEPDIDPRPYGQALYQILVAPIEQDLKGAQATTLMWSLDDVLRYIPMAALYDGKQYLVERYQNAVFTPASESRLTEQPQAQWNGLGLGVSQQYPGFAALNGVPQELDGVIHDPKITDSGKGTLPGTILLNQAFTQQAMTDALEGHTYPLVHIASHFDFEPGNETDSFLLLGDGTHLSLAQIKTMPQVFQGVDLLTLSACDTANGSAADANGNEVEGFAVLAQRQGARAVIASLWPVDDASTPLLMDTLYRNHATHPDQPKAEDLRQAQLALLHGTVSAPDGTIRGAQIVPDKANQPTIAKPFVTEPKAPYAHPYYWAPFILIGNWK